MNQKRQICGDEIQTGQLEFSCTKAYKHKGRHGTRWRLRNFRKDTRMVSVSWPSITQKQAVSVEARA